MFHNYGVNSKMSMQRQFEAVSMDNAGLEQQTANNVFRFGDTTVFPNNSFTWITWVYALSTAGTFNLMAGRETSTINRNIEFRFFFNSAGTNDLDFITSPAGNNLQQFQVSLGQTPLKEKWYMVAFTCTTSPSARKTAYIYDENQFIASGTTSTFGGIFSSANIAYQIGNTRDASGQVVYDQIMSAHGIWKGEKTAAFIRGIWNYGRGLQYDDLTSDQKTNIVAYWNLNDWDGTDVTDSVAAINAIKNSFAAGTVAKVSIIP